jgi:plastocyanin
MYGNALTPDGIMNLSFRPARITAHVGDTVRWTNHDQIVPHTATENHGLWDLAGSYGMTPLNPAGVAPGDSVQRTFEAGTQLYYCRVHPVQMHGEIDVPVKLLVTKRVIRRKHHKKRTVFMVHAVWDLGTPPSGLVFDVQRARGRHSFAGWLTGTTEGGGQFRAKRHTKWHVRARLRKAGSSTAATGWSPDVVITVR